MRQETRGEAMNNDQVSVWAELAAAAAAPADATPARAAAPVTGQQKAKGDEMTNRTGSGLAATARAASAGAPPAPAPDAPAGGREDAGAGEAAPAGPQPFLAVRLGRAEQQLPGEAAEKLYAIRAEEQARYAAFRAISDELTDTRTELQAAEAEARRFEDQVHGLGDDLAAPVRNQRAGRIEALRKDLARRQKVYDARAAAWQPVRALLHLLEDYVASAARVEAFAGNVTRPTGDPRAAVEKARRRVEELRVEIARTEAAPVPSGVAKARAVAEIDALAARGAPDVLGLVEGAEGVRWPRTAAHGRGGATVAVVDTLGLAAFLHADALKAAVVAEIDRRADDEAALSDEQRATRLADLATAQLAMERQEEAAVEAAAAAGFTVERRPDADPRAVLGLADSAPAPARGI